MHPLPSNRSFGFLFAGVFALLAGYASYRGSNIAVVYGWLSGALAFCLMALLAPGLLTPLNVGWMRLGELLGKLVNPLLLAFIFFVLITPVGVVTRLFGRDELRLKKKAVDSYWIDRDPHGPSGDSFKNQF